MALTDILNLIEARAAVNIPTGVTSQDSDLTLFVAGISSRVDALTGPVVSRSVTGERHSGMSAGRGRFMLDLQYVSAITSLSEWDGTTQTVLSAETDGVKTSSDYLLDSIGPYAIVYRRSNGTDAVFPAGRRNLVASYTAGRFANTASVTEQFKLAVSAVLRRMWKREQSSWAQTPDFFDDTENPTQRLAFFRAIEPMLAELLADQLLPPVGL